MKFESLNAHLAHKNYIEFLPIGNTEESNYARVIRFHETIEEIDSINFQNTISENHGVFASSSFLKSLSRMNNFLSGHPIPTANKPNQKSMYHGTIHETLDSFFEDLKKQYSADPADHVEGLLLNNTRFGAIYQLKRIGEFVFDIFEGEHAFLVQRSTGRNVLEAYSNLNKKMSGEMSSSRRFV